MLNVFGLGSFAGLINICDGADVLGVCTATVITDTSDVSQLLEYLLGGENPSTTTVGTWLTSTDLPNTTTPIANADVGSLLGITPAELSAPWNTFLDGLNLAAPLATPELLGNETLGALLAGLIYTPNLAEYLSGTGDMVTGATTVVDLLTALDPSLFNEPVFSRRVASYGTDLTKRCAITGRWRTPGRAAAWGERVEYPGVSAGRPGTRS